MENDILRKLDGSVLLAVLVFLPVANFEKTYDTNDWIPINPENDLKTTNRESKSSDRILNVESAEILRKPHIEHHKVRKSHKRSPNQNRIRPKFEQPYRFENVYNPKQHQTKTLPQKIPYQFQFAKVPQYSTIPQYQQQQQQPYIPQFQNFNNTYQNFQNLGPGVINSELFEAIPQKQHKFAPAPPLDDKDTVQLLYVPLEQLQKQPSGGGILDDAFKSLQQQKLLAQPQEQPKPQALPLVTQNQQVFIDNPKFLNQVLLQNDDFKPQEIVESKLRIPANHQPKYSTIPIEAFKLEQPQHPKLLQQQQIYLEKPKYSTIPVEAFEQPRIQQRPKQVFVEQPKYELISKNRGELILQNNPKSVHVAAKQQVQVQPVEQQQIVELTSEKPEEQQSQQTYFIPQQSRNPVALQEQQQQYLVQQQRIPLIEDGQINQQYVTHESIRNPEQQNQHTFRVQQPQNHAFSRQKSRLQDIQRDILQQTLEVEKLQQQIQQQGKSIEFSTTAAPSGGKRKPHQPPLAVFMGGNSPGDVETVLEILKDAKSISVQDQITPNSPRVFVGPSNLNTPEGFAKFPLPYLSNLDNNRIQRKAQQLPFFVAPLNYKEPDGYAKIPLPSPHVGSVVIRENQLLEPERPVAITNYKFVNPALESTTAGKNSNFDNNLNVYSLESSVPRESPNRQLQEQALFQQITGFSGFELPQNHQYFHQQVNPQPELSTPEVVAVKTTGRQRGESRGTKKGQSILKDAELDEARTEEAHTQTTLTQEYLNRFGGNAQNFQYSTPQAVEQTPANVRKLTPTYEINDGSLEQAIEELQKTRVSTSTTEDYQLPSQFTNINPKLPGLVNDLQDQEQPISTLRYETITTTTEQPSSTTHKPRGRGRSRFHMKSTTTPQPYRRPTTSERRRPQKPTTDSGELRNNYENIETERVHPRTRLQNSLTERVAEGSLESRTPPQQPTRVLEISQTQPNYFMEFLSTVNDERPILGSSEEVKTEPTAVRVVEQYQSEKIIPQSVQVTRAETTQRPSEDKPTRRRVRVRGRPKNVYSSTTAAPTTTTTQKENDEFYGFVRQPQFSQSSQINNNDEQLHIYAPVQQQQQRTSPVYIPETTEAADTTPVKFLGELRPKYASPSRATTTTTTEASSTRSRLRGRVRVPGRTTQETTEKTARTRSRGRTHFTPQRNVRQEETETENYPASYLRTRQTTPSSAEFKITIEPNEKNDIPKDEYKRKKQENFKVVNVDQFDTAETQNFRSILNAIGDPTKINELKSKETEETTPGTVFGMDFFGMFDANPDPTTVPNSDEEPQALRLTNSIPLRETNVDEEKPLRKTNVDEEKPLRDTNVDEGKPLRKTNVDEEKPLRKTNVDEEKSLRETNVDEATPLSQTNDDVASPLRQTNDDEATPLEVAHRNTSEVATTTDEGTISSDSVEGGEMTSTISEDEVRVDTTEATKGQTALDLMALQTSTATEISHETEICYKGRCVKSRNKKLRKPSS